MTLGKKGQVTIPRAILRAVGLMGDVPLLVETTPEGAILLRPAAVYPIEIYSDQRVAEFQRENAISPDLEARVRAWTREIDARLFLDANILFSAAYRDGSAPLMDAS